MLEATWDPVVCSALCHKTSCHP
ncbi:rCG33885, partial [Rattus norvegicus]